MQTVVLKHDKQINASQTQHVFNQQLHVSVLQTKHHEAVQRDKIQCTNCTWQTSTLRP